VRSAVSSVRPRLAAGGGWTVSTGLYIRWVVYPL